MLLIRKSQPRSLPLLARSNSHRSSHSLAGQRQLAPRYWGGSVARNAFISRSTSASFDPTTQCDALAIRTTCAVGLARSNAVAWAAMADRRRRAQPRSLCLVPTLCPGVSAKRLCVGRPLSPGAGKRPIARQICSDEDRAPVKRSGPSLGMGPHAPGRVGLHRSSDQRPLRPQLWRAFRARHAGAGNGGITPGRSARSPKRRWAASAQGAFRRIKASTSLFTVSRPLCASATALPSSHLSPPSRQPSCSRRRTSHPAKSSSMPPSNSGVRHTICIQCSPQA